MAKFENCEMEAVDKIPWKVDGTKIFKIYCSEEHWHDVQKIQDTGFPQAVVESAYQV